MIKIGDFSKLSCISIRMLRYYDTINLLKPAYIDNLTNYRFYEASQLNIASKIQKLKGFGFSTNEIKLMINDEKIINKFFNKKIIQLELEIDKIKKLQFEMKNIDNKLFNIVTKTIPKRRVISLRKVIFSYNDENLLWDELFQIIEKNNIKLEDNCYPIAIYHDDVYKKRNVDIEVQVSIKCDIIRDITPARVYVTDELFVASITFTGSYDLIDEVNQAALNWIEANNYSIIQPTFNIFHNSSAQTSDSSKWITEACYIIKER